MNKKNPDISINQKLAHLDAKKDLIKKVLIYMQSSRMPIAEKKMWIGMLPYMEEKHIIKLADILEREVNEYTEAYIASLKNTITSK